MTVMTNKRGKPIALNIDSHTWLCTKEFLNPLHKLPLVKTMHTGSMYGSLYGVKLLKVKEREIRSLIKQKKRELGQNFLLTKESGGK